MPVKPVFSQVQGPVFPWVVTKERCDSFHFSKCVPHTAINFNVFLLDLYDVPPHNSVGLSGEWEFFFSSTNKTKYKGIYW